MDVTLLVAIPWFLTVEIDAWGLEPVPGDSIDFCFSTVGAGIVQLPLELGLSATAFPCVIP